MQGAAPSRLQNKQYRHAYAEAQASAHRAAQITAMREDRGWKQSGLAEHAGMAQGRISLLEDPNYDTVSVSTLQRIAAAFDVALLVRFVSYKELLRWTNTRTDKSLHVPSFDDEFAQATELPPFMIEDVAAGQFTHGALAKFTDDQTRQRETNGALWDSPGGLGALRDFGQRRESLLGGVPY